MVSDGRQRLTDITKSRRKRLRVFVMSRWIKSSAEATHRALAAEVLGYAVDKQAIVPDLVSAMRSGREHA